MKKLRLLSVLLSAFAFIFFCADMVAFADETNVFDYRINADGTATIIGFKANDINIVIPEIVDAYKVTAIGDYAFSGMSGIEKVTINAEITSIGNSAFYGCTSLTTVEIPDTVTRIGEYAFGNCPLLTVDIIPDSVQNKNDKIFALRDDIADDTTSSDTEKPKDNTPIIVMVMIVSVFSAIACGVCIWMFVKSKRNKTN